MGMQINYWMEYEKFCELAETALSLGCIILKHDLDNGKVVQSRDISIVTKNCCNYYFYLPVAGTLNIKNTEFGERVDNGYNESGNSIIETGYTRIREKEKQISSNRLYLSTGYYDKNEKFIYRPDSIVDVYKKLARKVKKLAPYTELVEPLKEKDWVHKEYVSPYCLELRNEKGYSLCG